MTAEKSPYGSAEHAATEALNQSRCAYEGYVSTDSETVAEVVVAGLRERGFIVAKDHVRCNCGWQGLGNHDHDRRLGWATEGDPDA